MKNLMNKTRKSLPRSIFLIITLSMQPLSLLVLSANKMSPTEENTNFAQTMVIEKINLPPQFVAIPSQIADIAMGHRNGVSEIWGVSTDKTTLIHNTAGSATDLPARSLQLKKVIARDGQNNTISPLNTIQISPDGVILLLQDSVGNLYRYDWDKNYFIKNHTGNAYKYNIKKNRFVKTKYPLRLDSLSMGNSHTMWAMDSKKNIIYQFDEKTGTWHPRTRGISVSAGGDGTVVIIDLEGAAHIHTNNNKWHKLPGITLEKIICCSKNYIYGLSQNKLWRYDSIKKNWEPVLDDSKQPVSGIKDIKVNPIGALFLTGFDGTIYSNGKHVVSIHERMIKAVKDQKTRSEK